eukprot:PITA_29231
MTPYEEVYGQLPPSPTFLLTGAPKYKLWINSYNTAQPCSPICARIFIKLRTRIGEVAYKLALPPTVKIHPVFHVLCLKKVIGNNCRVQTSLAELDEEGSICLQPEQVLNTRDKHLHGPTIKEVLFKWKDTSPEDATWEPATILQQFPQLQP